MNKQKLFLFTLIIIIAITLAEPAKAFLGNIIFADAIQLDERLVGWRLVDEDYNVVCYKSLDNSPMVCMRIR